MFRDIGRYYDRVQGWFTGFYSDRESLALHYGLWSPSTRSRTEALTNPFREIRKVLDPKPTQRFLDAGCGVGGAALWLAAHTPARFEGVTVSRVQVERASRLASQRGVADRAIFHLGDFRRLPFPDASFDGAFALESLCYAYPDPTPVLRELLRVLKPGARIVVLDGTLLHHPNNPDEERWARDFAEGFGMPGWCTPEELERSARSAGFVDVAVQERTAGVMPSVRDIDRRSRTVAPLVRLGAALRLIPAEVLGGFRATRAQGPLFRSGLGAYVELTATKPS